MCVCDGQAPLYIVDYLDIVNCIHRKRHVFNDISFIYVIEYIIEQIIH